MYAVVDGQTLTLLLRPGEQRRHPRRVGRGAALEARPGVQPHRLEIGLDAAHERRGARRRLPHLGVRVVRLRAERNNVMRIS